MPAWYRPELGIYLFYFPMIAISMGIFGPGEKGMRLFFVLLPALLLVGLFLSDFNLIGPFEIETPTWNLSFSSTLFPAWLFSW